MSIQPIRKYVAPEIPDKLYFRIGDVARLCEVPAYVLRFWETEFPQLRPNKGGTGQRLYRKRDVEMALRIKSLLYDQGYTIPGARQVFKNEAKAREAVAAEAALPTPASAESEVSDQRAAPGIATPLPQPAADQGDRLRRNAALQALRDELCALLVILEQPLNCMSERPSHAAPAPKVQTLRPRLVLESKPLPIPVETLRLVATQRSQGDLFGGE